LASSSTGVFGRWRQRGAGRELRARLYVRYPCELCEEALELLRPFERDGRLTIERVDVDSDRELLRRFGLTIPVLEIVDGPCLEWPFDEPDLRRALR
jgi:hypothetical protein